MKVQCLAWVHAVLSNSRQIYAAPSVLMNATCLMLLYEIILEPGKGWVLSDPFQSAILREKEVRGGQF